MKKKLLVSVSGGETSADMAKKLKDQLKLTPVHVYHNKGNPVYTYYTNDGYDVIFAFANTSREDNRTLNFVEKLKTYFGINCIWVEAVVHDGRIGTTHKIVNWHTAKRDGSVFEGVIQKYGIPNRMYIHCTRELKAQTINSLCKSLGWVDWVTAIGYRFDEPKRVNFITAEKLNQWYPLYEWKITKSDVKYFWSKQVFNLGLQEFEGNCKLCYKKSTRKLLTQIVSDPKSTEWIGDMESKYRFHKKAERNEKTYPENGIMFFRGNESIHDLMEQSKEDFEPATDPFLKDPKVLDLFKEIIDADLDDQESCSESCEPFSIND